MNTRGCLKALGMVGVATLLAGCFTAPVRPPNPDGTYCFRVGKSYRPVLTCTTKAIPAESLERTAKRFEPQQGLLTVYLVRKRWGDTKNLVRVSSGTQSAETVPESFVRWTFPAGSHRLVATWSGGATSLDVQGDAGQVLFVELIGTVWVWGSSYRMEQGDPAGSRERASGLRLVADVG